MEDALKKDLDKLRAIASRARDLQVECSDLKENERTLLFMAAAVYAYVGVMKSSDKFNLVQKAVFKDRPMEVPMMKAAARAVRDDADDVGLLMAIVEVEARLAK